MPGKILRRAAAWLLALTVVLTLVPGEGRAVLDGVYLTAANEQLSSGSTVYVTVSAGPNISYVEMPNLIGLSEEAAISKLESCGLSFGSSEFVRSDLDAGTVIGQSTDAFTDIEEHSKIYLRVSSGPEG